MDARKKSRIEKVANEVLKSNHLFSAGFDTTKLVKKLGFNLYFKNLPSNIYGASKITDDETVITINEDNAPTRQRFSIAHELGHIFLHQEISLHFSDRLIYAEFNRDEKSAAGTDWREIEANYFAACLLMPKILLEKEIENFNFSLDENEIDELAEKFKVSPVAMTIRLTSLGYR